MPGRSLKLNAVAASIHCSPKPHNRLRPLTSAADAADKLKFPAVPTTRAWWRRRITTIPPLSRDRIFRDHFVLGFRVRKYPSHLAAARSISAAHMGSDPHNKDGQRLNASSPPQTNPRHDKPSQRPHKSAKLLTLPTILTIGRVVAVPLLVSCKFRS